MRATIVIEELHAEVVVGGDPVIIEVGIAGPQGPAGDEMATYEHDQSAPSDTWLINHNLGRNPSVSLRTVGGLEMWGQILHTSINQVQVFFNSAVAGRAYMV